VKRERHEKTGVLLPYSKRFFNFGASVLKMSLYRDLQKDDPQMPGFVAFPSGLGDDYFQELTAERRTAVKRHGFTVYRWTKDDRQDNEALDTMLICTAAAIRYGVYGLPDQGWEKRRLDRETPPEIKPPLGPGERRGVTVASRLAR
jgi:phage terminase large subunit GpA-like protein